MFEISVVLGMIVWKVCYMFIQLIAMLAGVWIGILGIEVNR
jgi:hypothetical protein